MDDENLAATLQEKGVQMPLHLKSKMGRWTSLILTVVISCFASGPVAAWPTLEPILIQEGVFAGPNQLEDLTMVYTIASSIGLISYLFSGMLYDVVGPRALAASSAFLTAVCLVVMAISIKFQACNNLLWVFYPLTVCFGYMNTMGGYAWLFLLPTNLSMVAALVGAVQVFSDTMVLIAVWLHNDYGFSLSVYLLLTALLSVVAGFVCIALIPSLELYRQAGAILQSPNKMESKTYGAADGSGIDAHNGDADSAWDAVKKIAIAGKNCIVVAFGIYPGAFILTLLVCFSSYMFALYPALVMYPFYDAMFGKTKATILVDIYGGIYGSTAAISLLLLGRLLDYIGFTAFLALFIPWSVATMIFLYIPDMTSQVIAQFFFIVQASPAAYLLVPRWCVSHMPPELYGSAFGFYAAIMGILEIFLVPLGTWLAFCVDAVIDHGHQSLTFTLLSTMTAWCVLTVISPFAYILFLQIYPMPSPGSTTMADVRKVLGNDPDASVEPIARKSILSRKLGCTPTCSPCMYICNKK